MPLNLSKSFFISIIHYFYKWLIDLQYQLILYSKLQELKSTKFNFVTST